MDTVDVRAWYSSPHIQMTTSNYSLTASMAVCVSVSAVTTRAADGRLTHKSALWWDRDTHFSLSCVGNVLKGSRHSAGTDGSCLKLERLVVAAEEEGSRVWLGRCWFTEAGPRLATCRGVCEGGWVGRWWWSCKGSFRAALWSCVKCSVSGEGL